MSEIKAKILSSNNGAVGFDGNGVLWQTKNLATADLTVGGAGWQALDANGSAGNYEVILDLGFHTGGTYSYPNGRTELDYSLIMITAGNSSNTVSTTTIMSSELLSSGWGIASARWDANAQGYIIRDDANSFTVSVSGGGVSQIIGYLKEGVI